MTHPIRSASSKLRRSTVLLLGLTTLITGCVDVDDPRSQTVATYNPSGGAIPIPNDLLFSGSVDGTINIAPALDENGNPLPVPEPLLSLSSVDGASTVAPILMNFSRAISGGISICHWPILFPGSLPAFISTRSTTRRNRGCKASSLRSPSQSRCTWNFRKKSRGSDCACHVLILFA
mgnify:CR=1 FL=1